MTLKTRHTIFLFITSFIWGTAFVAQSVGMDYLPPMAFNGIRTLLGGLVLLPFIWLTERRKPLDQRRPIFPLDDKMLLKGGVLCGLVLGVASILQQASLLYITAGRGEFSSESIGREKPVPVEAGTMLLLFPGEWHNYRPLPETGWTEYWIGFNGEAMERLVAKGFFSRSKPTMNVSIQGEIADLYARAIEIAENQQSGFQPALSGIVHSLLGLAYYYDRNRSFVESNAAKMVARAKILVAENITTIDPKSLSDALCISYSSFRRIFREYTGFSPAKYILHVKINQAKELLTNSPAEIKEIAFDLGFENTDYFFTVFHRLTGQTPLAYRVETQGRKI